MKGPRTRVRKGGRKPAAEGDREVLRGSSNRSEKRPTTRGRSPSTAEPEPHKAVLGKKKARPLNEDQRRSSRREKRIGPSSPEERRRVHGVVKG